MSASNIEAPAPPPITMRGAVGYGTADFGFNLFYTGLNLYLLFFYTDVLGIGAASAGTIFGLAVAWDAVTDPVMGWIATRTRQRLGGFRPYLLFGAPLVGLSFVGMFAAPLVFPSMVVVVSAVSHLLFRTAYTLVSIPYSSLSSVITFDSKERGMLAGMRMIFAILGGLFTAALTLPLAKALGGESQTSGFVYVGLLYAAIATTLMWATYFSTHEAKPKRDHDSTLSLKDSIRVIRTNSAFWLLFLGIFTLSVGTSISGKALVYYVTYVVGSAQSVPLVLSMGLGTAALSVPLWVWLSARFDKRTIWFVGVGIYTLMQTVLLVLAPTLLGPLLALHVLSSLGVGAFVVLLWSMLPDTIEFAEARTGIRDEGIHFGINQFALKAASAFGVASLGFALSSIGYTAGTEQEPSTLQGLRFLTFGAPVAAAVLSLLAISRYPIGHASHAELRARIGKSSANGQRKVASVTEETGGR